MFIFFMYLRTSLLHVVFLLLVKYEQIIKLIPYLQQNKILAHLYVAKAEDTVTEVDQHEKIFFKKIHN